MATESGVLLPPGVEAPKAPDEEAKTPESNVNGEAREPDIKIWFDNESRDVKIMFNDKTIKTWPFCKMILTGATEAAEFMTNVARAQAMQQKAMEQQAMQAIHQSIAGGPGYRPRRATH